MKYKLKEMRDLELKCLSDLSSVLDSNEWIKIYRKWLSVGEYSTVLDYNIIIIWIDNFVITKYLFEIENYVKETISIYNKNLQDDILLKLKDYL